MKRSPATGSTRGFPWHDRLLLLLMLTYVILLGCLWGAHLEGTLHAVKITPFDTIVPPGAKTAPQKHMYEEVHYVLSGHGSTTVELPDGSSHTFEWGPKSLFALPLNCSYQHFNGSGQETARLSSTNNLPMVLNLFHQEKFVFDNPCSDTPRS